MPRTWNTTGLYKAQKDRAPAKRSRRIKASAPAARLVPLQRAPECQECGFGLDTNAHRLFCGHNNPYAACDAPGWKP